MRAPPLKVSHRYQGDECQIIVVMPREGFGTVSLGDATQALDAGTFCAYHSCKHTDLDYRSPSRHLIATLPSRYLADRCPEWDCDTLLAMPATQGVGSMFVEFLQSLARNQDDLAETCRQDAFQFTLSLLTSAVRSKVESGANSATHVQSYHKKRIRDFVLSRLGDPELDIPLVAAKVGLSVRYIHRLFMSEPLHLMHWIYEQRLTRCHQDLVAADKMGSSISEIAFAWGFNSPAHFCRAYRKRFGMTPSEYRRTAKNRP